jgi:DNA polymerase-3 subunit delta
MRILFLIARQFNMLLQTRVLLQRRCDNRVVGEKLGISPYIAKKYMAQASKFELQFLRSALEECVQTEEDVKTGKMTDTIAVELLIIRYSK